ncbi:PE domain-containing protein [Amycolatopsis sp. H20-H5]|uniref:PE domain-containing protein n=1 Tax=Amycolatopsis sp. H20-H5 TaxID=3046309 RepID=UPI002DB75F82|nr:PE domain-containing protein [Amycolatopsis sp. H20-H5]MEC3980653.1 PE domain-containing protein [Amycolatopsis sp. H20-H5]
MGDTSTGGLQGVQNQLNTNPQQAPPPDAGLVQGSTAATPPPAGPNYTNLGAGQAKADFAAASGNGGWKFDPEAMDSVIKDLEDSIKHDFSRATNEVSHLTGIDAMGDEVASHVYVDAANRSGAQYQAFLTSAVDYTRAYVKTLRDIKTAYEQQDQAAIDALRDTGKAL